jgi:hypothetical protein
MKLLKLTASIGSALFISFGSVAAELKTADEVIAKYGEARNLEKLKTVKTMRSEFRMIMNGMEVPVTLEVKRPNQARMEMTIQGMALLQVIDGAEGWKVNPMLGKTAAQPMTEDEFTVLSDMSEIEGPLGDYRKKGHSVELKGTTDVDGSPAYKLQLTRKSGDIEYHYIDTENFMPVRYDRKVTMNGTPIETTGTSGDFKLVDGMMLPHSMSSTMKLPMGEIKQVMTVTKVEFNTPIDSTRFKKPSTEK